MFYGDMPDVGVERHLRGLSDETKKALDAMRWPGHGATRGAPRRVHGAIDAEETESRRLKAERAALRRTSGEAARLARERARRTRSAAAHGRRRRRRRALARRASGLRGWSKRLPEDGRSRSRASLAAAGGDRRRSER